MRVVIIGASDLGTACSLRLMRAGIEVVLVESTLPLDIYHSRSFSSAAFSGIKSIENITARTFAHTIEEGSLDPESNLADFIAYTTLNRDIPLITETDTEHLKHLEIGYTIICEPELFKHVSNSIHENSLIIGFDKEKNPDHYIYTICNDGAYFGRVLYPFIDRTDIFIRPAFSKKQKFERIKAPIEGVFQSSKLVDELVHEKEEIGKINEIPILSPALGRINGILNSGIIVPAGSVFAEVDTGHTGLSGNLISKNSLCLAGALLEVLLYNVALNKTK